MKNKLSQLALIGVFCLFSGAVNGQPNLDGEHVNKNKSGVAIQGYDPVSYFIEEDPAEGVESFKYTYNGATYYFKSESNLIKFKNNPDAYAPKYGGWCAYAMGVSGDKVKIDPETYKIVDGMLYLFYNFRFTNTLTKWNEDETNLLPKANEYWRKITEPKSGQ